MLHRHLIRVLYPSLREKCTCNHPSRRFSGEISKCINRTTLNRVQRLHLFQPCQPHHLHRPHRPCQPYRPHHLHRLQKLHRLNLLVKTRKVVGTSSNCLRFRFTTTTFAASHTSRTFVCVSKWRCSRCYVSLKRGSPRTTQTASIFRHVSMYFGAIDWDAVVVSRYSFAAN